jgi:hypothetical protein
MLVRHNQIDLFTHQPGQRCLVECDACRELILIAGLGLIRLFLAPSPIESKVSVVLFLSNGSVAVSEK